MSDKSESSTNVEWLDIINNHEAVAPQIATEGDFSMLNQFIAKSAAIQPKDYRRVLLTVTGSDDTNSEMQNINITLAQASQTAIEIYSDAVTKQNTITVHFDWNGLLDTERTKAMEYVTAQINGALDKAKSLISALPDDARSAAATQYAIGNNYAREPFYTLTRSTGNMNESIPQFMNGNFQAITDTVNAVTASVNYAIDRIKNFS